MDSNINRLGKTSSLADTVVDSFARVLARVVPMEDLTTGSLPHSVSSNQGDYLSPKLGDSR